MGFRVVAPIIVPLCQPLVHVPDKTKIILTSLLWVVWDPVSREQGRQAVRALAVWERSIQLSFPGRKQETLSKFLGDIGSLLRQVTMCPWPPCSLPIPGEPHIWLADDGVWARRGREPTLPERSSKFGTDMGQWNHSQSWTEGKEMGRRHSRQGVEAIPFQILVQAWWHWNPKP